MDSGSSENSAPPLYLVTGGCGFIGRKLAHALKRGSQRVRVLDRKECKPHDRIEGVEYMVGDVCDLQSRACYWACEKVDTVFHCARLSDPTADYNTHYETNVRGTDNIIEAAQQQGVSSVIYTSSVSVVVDGSDINGGDETMPYPETHLDHASATKAIAEQRVISANGMPSAGNAVLHTCCVRPEMVFGPGDNHFVPQLLDKAREGEITHMIGDGSNLVDFTYVDNVVLAHLLAAEHMVDGSPALGQVYFVTNGEARPFWDFLTAIFDGMGYPPPTKAIGQRLAYGTAFVLEKAGGLLKYFMAFRPKLTRQLVFNMSMNHYFSHRKATMQIGYTPVVTLGMGIERTLDWIRTGRYETDVAVFDRWAKVREAVSPDRPRVIVPLTSRHSSSSSIAEAGEGMLNMTTADASLLGFGPNHSFPQASGSPPRRYGTSPSDGDVAALHIGAPGWVIGNGHAEKVGILPDGVMAHQSGRGSPTHIPGQNGSFCASIPEENEVADFNDINSYGDYDFSPSECRDLHLSDEEEVDNEFGGDEQANIQGLNARGGSGNGSGSGSPVSSKRPGQIPSEDIDARGIGQEGVWRAATHVIG